LPPSYIRNPSVGRLRRSLTLSRLPAESSARRALDDLLIGRSTLANQSFLHSQKFPLPSGRWQNRCMRFAMRHWTAILIIVVVAGWALFYLPTTPSYAIFQLKQKIDALDGDAAATYVDFQQVVRNAGYEMVQGQNNGAGDNSNIIGQLIGRSAVDLFSGPMAALLRQWSIQQVDNGAKEVQMPKVAVAGAILMLHRNDNTAYTQWKDKKGQVWEVQMVREDNGWKIVEVKNVRQLLEKLKRHEMKQFNTPPPAYPPTPSDTPPRATL
jgi:hypothetical protein